MANENKTLSLETCYKIEQLAKKILNYFSSIGLLEINDQIIDMTFERYPEFEWINSNKEARYLLESYIYFPNLEEFERIYLEKGKNPILVASHFGTQPSKVTFAVFAVDKYRRHLPPIAEEVILETDEKDTIAFVPKTSKIAAIEDEYNSLIESNTKLRRAVREQNKQIELLKKQIKILNAEYNVELYNRSISNDSLEHMLLGDRREEYFGEFYIMTPHELPTVFSVNSYDKSLDGDSELRSETVSLKTLCNMAEIRNNRLKCLNFVFIRVIEDLETDITMLIEALRKYKTPEEMQFYENLIKSEPKGPWWGTIEDDHDPDVPTPGGRN